MNGQLESKTAIQAGKPVHVVFEAIADPQQMSNYFIAWLEFGIYLREGAFDFLRS
ncbi:MAG: hypothetical protein WCO44_05655 [Bacteroidota bacterium]